MPSRPDGKTLQYKSSIHRLSGGLVKTKMFRSKDESERVLESIFPNERVTGEKDEIRKKGFVQRDKELTDGQVASLGWEVRATETA